MKILHILSQIPDATGSGIYLQAALRHAAVHGHENYLLAGVPADSDHHLQLHLKADNYQPVNFERDLPFPVVGMSDVMPYSSTRFCDLSATQLALYRDAFEGKLSEAVERWQPDLIHSHHLWLLTSLARQLFPNIPLVTSCHGSDLRQFNNCKHLQSIVLEGCRRVDAVCALSQIQRLEIEQLYGIESEKIHVIGAGFDTERFYWPLHPPCNKPLEILYAGKLSRAKGVPWLLRALRKLPREQFIFHLVGEGSGADKHEITELCASFGPAVRQHGRLGQDRLAELMRQVDIFALPSFFEGLPLVLLEALACGCRVVTTALPGIKELFSGLENGRVELVEMPNMIAIDVPHPADEEEFTDKLAVALQKQCSRTISDDTKICPRPLQDLLKNYTWEGIFRNIETLYRQLLAESTSSANTGTRFEI